LGSNGHEFIEGLCWNEKAKKDEEKNIKDPLLIGVEILHTDGCCCKSFDYSDQKKYIIISSTIFLTNLGWVTLSMCFLFLHLLLS
jgi:hypothetical protein